MTDQPPTGESFTAELTGMVRGVLAPSRRRMLVVALLAGFASWGMHITHLMFMGDDWTFVFPDNHRFLEMNLEIGRWLAYAVHRGLSDAAFAPTFLSLIALLALIAASLLVASAAALHDGLAGYLLVGAFVTSPLHSEFMGFEILHLPEGLGILLGTATGVVLTTRASNRWGRGALACLLLVLALALYQPTALYALIVAAGIIALRTVGTGTGYATGHVQSLVDTVLAYVVATIVYSATVRLSWAVTGSGPTGREAYALDSGYVSLGSLPGQVATALAAIVQFWTTPTVMFPLEFKILLLVLMAAGLARMVGHRSGTTLPPVVQSTLGVALGLVMLLAPFATWFVRSDMSTRYNSFAPLSMGIAILAAVAVVPRRGTHPWDRPWRRSMAVLAVGVVLTGFGFTNARSAGGMYLANQRDMAFANRVLDRIESDIDYQESGRGSTVRVGLVGSASPHLDGRPFRYLPPDPRFGSLVGCGTVDCQPKRLIPALNLLAVDGTRFVRASPQQIGEALDLDPQSLPVWPAEGSVRYTSEGVVVRLG